MTRIAAFSKRFPPCFKRRWYVVKSEGGFRIRFMGSTMNKYFTSLNEALNIMEELTALYKLGLVLERVI
jgi:hypothetical protein